MFLPSAMACVRLREQLVHRGLQALGAVGSHENNRQCDGLEAGPLNLTKFCQVVVGQNRRIQRYQMGILGAGRAAYFASVPMVIPAEVTISSRIQSIGGLVTCAKSCWK